MAKTCGFSGFGDFISTPPTCAIARASSTTGSKKPAKHSKPARAGNEAVSPERGGFFPLLLGPKNCEAATGLPWRFVRDHARQLGIEPIRVGKKLCVPVAAFLGALRPANGDYADEQVPADAAAQLRERLGLRLVAPNDAQRITNAPKFGTNDADSGLHEAGLPSGTPAAARREAS